MATPGRPRASPSATARLSLSSKEGAVAEGGPRAFTTFLGPERLADKCHFNKNLFKKKKKKKDNMLTV